MYEILNSIYIFLKTEKHTHCIGCVKVNGKSVKCEIFVSRTINSSSPKLGQTVPVSLLPRSTPLSLQALGSWSQQRTPWALHLPDPQFHCPGGSTGVATASATGMRTLSRNQREPQNQNECWLQTQAKDKKFLSTQLLTAGASVPRKPPSPITKLTEDFVHAKCPSRKFTRAISHRSVLEVIH